MIKIVFCLRRKAELTPDAFQVYWLGHHAGLVKERARALGIRRYVQSHTLWDQRLGGLAKQRGFAGEPFDGVAELWFDAVESLYPNHKAPDWSIKAAMELLDDEGRFIDLPNSPIFVAREHVVIPLAGTD